MLCFFFKQKTAYEMRISHLSSDVLSSDLDLKLRLKLQQELVTFQSQAKLPFQFRPSSHLLREFIAEKFHAIAAVFLGLIHSHIRRPQQRMQRFAMLGIESHADRRAQVDLLATYIE